MKQTPGTSKDAADRLVRGIKRKTRKHYSAEEKIRIVLAGLRGETRDFRTLRRDRGTEWRSLRFCDIGSGGFVIGCKILAALVHSAECVAARKGARRRIDGRMAETGQH